MLFRFRFSEKNFSTPAAIRLERQLYTERPKNKESYRNMFSVQVYKGSIFQLAVIGNAERKYYPQKT